MISSKQEYIYPDRGVIFHGKSNGAIDAGPRGFRFLFICKVETLAVYIFLEHRTGHHDMKTFTSANIQLMKLHEHFYINKGSPRPGITSPGALTDTVALTQTL